MELSYTVAPKYDGREIRQLVRNPLGLSHKLWKRIKWNGKILVNGREHKNARLIVRAGDQLLFSWQENSPVVPAQMPLAILYEDASFLLVNKPAHILIHPTHHEARDTLVHAVAGYYQQSGQNAGIHPLYRLDRDTTGIVILAKSARIQYAMTKSHDQIYREYLAFISGHMTQPRGRIALPLARNPQAYSEWMVRNDGRTAITDYEVLQAWPDYSLLRIHLLTGRTHQIRVHFAHLGHSLLGDALYGGPSEKIRRQALHAARVKFCHPETGQMMVFQSPLPEDMRMLLPDVSRETLI